MAAAQKAPKVIDEATELPNTPIKIHIPKTLKQYTTNLKYLAALYQEILLDTCRGKVSERELEIIEKISNELILKLVK